MAKITNLLALLSERLTPKETALVRAAVEYIHEIEQQNIDLIADNKELKNSLKMLEYEIQEWEVANDRKKKIQDMLS